jgi:hypothetical protein
MARGIFHSTGPAHMSDESPAPRHRPERPKWDAREIEWLIRLRADPSLSASQIGAIMGKSRNAVIGQCSRLQLIRGAPAGAGASTDRAAGAGATRRNRQSAANPASRICPCGGPAQPGRGLCAGCINRRMRPNPRAGLWAGIRDGA